MIHKLPVTRSNSLIQKKGMAPLTRRVENLSYHPNTLPHTQNGYLPLNDALKQVWRVGFVNINAGVVQDAGDQCFEEHHDTECTYLGMYIHVYNVHVH